MESTFSIFSTAVLLFFILDPIGNVPLLLSIVTSHRPYSGDASCFLSRNLFVTGFTQASANSNDLSSRF